MAPSRAKDSIWSRRSLLSFIPAAALAANDPKVIPSERVRLLDSATDFEISRVTSPQHASILPRPQSRIFSRRGGLSLLFSSDHSGSLQACQLDLKTWEQRVITDAKELNPASLCLTADERALVYLDGNSLRVAQFGVPHSREIGELQGGGDSPALHVIPDGAMVIAVDDGNKLRAIPVVKGAARTIVENAEGVLNPMPRPRRAAIAYSTKSGALFLAYLDGSRNVPIKTTPGKIASACWSPDGKTILYLHFPNEGEKTSHLREVDPDSGQDRLVAKTSQFAQFSPNADATVFVGASASLAQPHILLLLRSVRRELTIAEHKSSDANAVHVVFTPDSQRIFFQSDRQGKPAIYSMNVDRLVEKTSL